MDNIHESRKVSREEFRSVVPHLEKTNSNEIRGADQCYTLDKDLTRYKTVCSTIEYVVCVML